MLRALVDFVALLFFFAIARSVISTVWKMFSVGMSPEPARHSPPAPPRASGSGGELRRDPVCGTFILAESAIQKQFNGKIEYFCSKACRDRHQAA